MISLLISDVIVQSSKEPQGDSLNGELSSLFDDSSMALGMFALYMFKQNYIGIKYITIRSGLEILSITFSFTFSLLIIILLISLKYVLVEHIAKNIFF